MAWLLRRACRRATLLAFAALLCVLVGVAGAALAPPGWLPPRTLSDPAADAVIPDVAVDSHGNVTAVWGQAKNSEWTVQAVQRPAGGAWSAPVALSTPASIVAPPQLAVAGSNAVVVWARYDGKNLIVQASSLDTTTGSWSAPASLSAPGRDAAAPRVAIDADGDAVVVWASISLPGSTIQAAYRPRGGAWQPTVPLDAPTVQTAAPDVVIDGKGRAVAAWAESAGSGSRVYSSARGVDGTWSNPVAISAADATTSITPQLALEGNGDVTAVWSRSLGTATVIESATRNAATGAWSRVGQLFPTGPDAIAPQIAVNKRGDGILVWTSSDPKSGLSVVASFRPAGKPWGKPVVLVPSATGAPAPQPAIDAKGNAVVVWARTIGGVSRVQGTYRAIVGNVWATRRSLSRIGADSVTPQVSLDADGDGAAVWARVSGQEFVIQGDGYDATGPVLNKLLTPVTGVAGKKVVFGVTPTDVWSAVRTIRWSFGDGSTGSGRLTGHVYNRAGRFQVTVTATDSFGHARSVKRWVQVSG